MTEWQDEAALHHEIQCLKKQRDSARDALIANLRVAVEVLTDELGETRRRCDFLEGRCASLAARNTELTLTTREAS